ncbi:MAG: F0F1 ATP synthase subunit delta [Propionibacteriaceae bacterium]|nr:F0F1 ATP synthase subunit delta [Propionibacteriaceae bacterium]
MRVVDEAKLSALDAGCDARAASLAVAEEIFAVVDVLDSSAGLRRAFTDPASSAEARVGLGERIFGTKVSADAQWVLGQALDLRWRNGHCLSDALERQGVRLVLRAAQQAGKLDAVIADLGGFGSAVREHDALREALRDTSFDLAARRSLVGRITEGKVSEFSEVLLARAVGARERTYRLTLERYLQLAADLRSRQIARVTVAKPLTAAQEERLRSLLAAQAGAEIDLQIELDPSVLGGIRVQFGNDRIESTVAARLDDVHRQLTA